MTANFGGTWSRFEHWPEHNNQDTMRFAFTFETLNELEQALNVNFTDEERAIWMAQLQELDDAHQKQINLFRSLLYFLPMMGLLYLAFSGTIAYSRWQSPHLTLSLGGYQLRIRLPSIELNIWTLYFVPYLLVALTWLVVIWCLEQMLQVLILVERSLLVGVALCLIGCIGLLLICE